MGVRRGVVRGPLPGPAQPRGAGGQRSRGKPGTTGGSLRWRGGRSVSASHRRRCAGRGLSPLSPVRGPVGQARVGPLPAQGRRSDPGGRVSMPLGLWTAGGAAPGGAATAYAAQERSGPVPDLTSEPRSAPSRPIDAPSRSPDPGWPDPGGPVSVPRRLRAAAATGRRQAVPRTPLRLSLSKPVPGLAEGPARLEKGAARSPRLTSETRPHPMRAADAPSRSPESRLAGPCAQSPVSTSETNPL